MAKRKITKKRKVATKRKVTTRKNYKVSQVKEDAKQRRKFERGGRIEAYTFGEVL